MALTYINLKEMLCADPMHGGIYQSLFNGGSWFEADQTYWASQQNRVVLSLSDLMDNKPSKSNIAKAEAWLTDLKTTSEQLVATAGSHQVFSSTEKIVKEWEAPTLKKVALSKKSNAFAMLDEDEE